MSRIFSTYAYGPGPRRGCFWDESAAKIDWPRLRGDIRADVCVIGAGFTGLNAAIALAAAGAEVVVLEAEAPGWGASGRNGGFCCLGGGRLPDAQLRRRFGTGGVQDWHKAQAAAIEHVAAVLERHGIDADRHSRGEVRLAHRPRDMRVLEAEAADIAAVQGDSPRLISKDDLAAEGLAGPFHGGLHTPLGFALNPRKYLDGLAQAARDAGVRIFARSPVLRAEERDLRSEHGRVRAAQVLVATNGYSSETLPNWLSGRYMPAQSTVLVTRPLSAEERAASGWTSDLMAYDTRNLLHYFRLMPDGRFLFGARGGLLASAGAEARSRQRLRRHFETMFPAWRSVEITHSWSGFVCLARGRMPFAGPIPGRPGWFAALAYHGNGVAMGSYCGHLVGRAMAGDDAVPAPLRAPLERFPLGRGRRAAMPGLYALLGLSDL